MLTRVTSSERLGRLAERLGRRQTLLPLAVLEVAILATENTADFPLSVPYLRRTTGQEYLDMCAFFPSAKVYEVLDGLGPSGRSLQALLLVTVDIVIPGVSFLFGTALLGALLAKREAYDWRRSLLLIPLLALVLDFAENTAIALLLAFHPTRLPMLATIEGLLSGVKFTAYLAVLVAAFALAVERWSRREPQVAR